MLYSDFMSLEIQIIMLNDIKKQRLSKKDYDENFDEIHPPLSEQEEYVEGER